MLEVIICEDEDKQRSMMSKVLSNIILMEDYDMKLVLEASKPDEVIEYLDKNDITGLYFLDIDLDSDINGIELASKIREKDPRGFIVFVTNHVELSIESFKYKIEAMDFIAKSDIIDNKERIHQCLDNAFQKYTSTNTSLQKVFSVKSKGRVTTIPFDEIIYFETTEVKHRIRLHGDKKLLEFYGHFKEIEETLDDRFIKSHRSYIVNKNRIQEVNFHKGEILMDNKELCLLSKRAAKTYKNVIV